jgi:hypothetical protein
VPERGGALQVQHVGVRRQLRGRGGDPVQGGSVVDAVGAAEQRPARLGLLVDEHDPRARPGGGERGDEAGGARPDDEQVGVGVLRVVAGRVGHVGEPALPGDAAGRQPVDELDRGGEQHRLGEGLLDLHQAARVLRPRRADAARAAERDARAGGVHAVRQQCRGEGVAGVPGVGHAAEREAVGGGAVDPAPCRDAELGHEITGRGSSGR